MGFYSDQIHAGATETEIEFVQRIIDMITGIDPRITCNTTAAAQYLDTTATATFDFDIDGKYILRMKRAAVNSQQVSTYKFSTIIDDVEYNVSGAIRMWTTNSTGSTVVGNGYDKVSAYVTDNDIFIWFGAKYNSEVTDIFPNNYLTGFVTDDNDNAYCYGYYNSNDVQAQSFYKTDGTAGFSLVKVLNYAEEAGTGRPAVSAGPA